MNPTSTDGNNQEIKATPLYLNTFTVENLSSYQKRKYSLENKANYSKIIINIIISIFILISSYFAYLFSQTSSFNLAKSLVESTPLVRNSLTNVGESIESHYNFILNQKVGAQNTLLNLKINRFSQDVENLVAGANIERNFLLSNAKIISLLISYDSNRLVGKKNNKILGISTQGTSKVIVYLRRGKEYAGEVLNNTQIAKKELESFKLKIKKYPTSNKKVQAIIDEVNSLNQQSEVFILEAEKTANYYYQIYNINLKLVPELAIYSDVLQNISTSPNPSDYVSQLDEIEFALINLESQLKKISVSELPKGIEDLHSDNLKVFQILIRSVKTVKKNLAQNNIEGVVNAIRNLNEEIQPINAKASQAEVNFWQDNRVLRSYKNLIEGYSKNEAELREFLEKTNKPFLEDIAALVE